MNQYVLSYWEDIKLIDESDDPYIKRNACSLIGFYTKFCHLIYQQFLDTGEWQCGEAGMLRLFGISDQTFGSYIKALEQLGLIQVTRAKFDPKENKRNYANIYRVTGLSDPYRKGQQENKPQAASEPRVKKLKEQPAQPAQVNKAIEAKDDEWERAAYCVGNDDDFNSIISEDMAVYNDEPEKDSNPNPPKTNDKAIESQPGVDDNRANHEPKDPNDDLYLSAARKLKANGLTREKTQQIKAKVKPNMSIRKRMEIVCDSLYDYAKGLTDDEYSIAMERISAAAYEEAVVRSEQNREKKNRTLEELNAPDFKDEGTHITEVNDAVADFQIQEVEGMFKEAVA